MRELIIPTPPAPDEPAIDDGRASEPPAELPSRRRRIPWPELLRRVFRVDIERCHCGGRLKLVAFVTDPTEARRYLAHVGLPAELPVIAPARAPPQLDFESC